MRIAKAGWITDRILLLGREESNVYLLKGEEYTMVGGGMITIVPDVLEQLTAFGIEESRITRLLILHTHFDHCGTAPYFSKRWPHLKVVASKRGKEMLENPKVVESISFLCKAALAESSAEAKTKALNLTVKQKRKYKVTTDSKHHLPVAENVLQREFSPQAPNRDRYYLPVDTGGLGLPGGGDRPIFTPRGGLVDGSAHEQIPGDPGLDGPST